jgi:hypothetical protein
MENNENNENNENINTNEQRRLQNIQRFNEIVEQRRNSNEPLSIPINFELTVLTGINIASSLSCFINCFFFIFSGIG